MQALLSILLHESGSCKHESSQTAIRILLLHGRPVPLYNVYEVI